MNHHKHHQIHNMPRCYASFPCEYKKMQSYKRSKTGNYWKAKQPIQMCYFDGHCSLQNLIVVEELAPKQ